MTTPEMQAERARWQALPENIRLYIFALANGVDTLNTRKALNCADVWGLSIASRDIGDLRKVIA